MAGRTLVELISWLEDLFERHSVRRSYGGAIARNFHALPRLTKDVDVLVLVAQLEIPPLVQDLIEAGASALVIDDETGFETALPLDLRRLLDDFRGGSRMTRLLCFGVRVELFAPWHPFDHEVLARAELRELGGRRIRVHTPEDLIVYKMVFGRSKDIEDIKAIVASQAGSLDLDRIRASASQLLDDAGLRELEDLLRDDPP
jgi:hypothetical protein